MPQNPPTGGTVSFPPGCADDFQGWLTTYKKHVLFSDARHAKNLAFRREPKPAIDPGPEAKSLAGIKHRAHEKFEIQPPGGSNIYRRLVKDYARRLSHHSQRSFSQAP